MNLFRSEEHVKNWSLYDPVTSESIMSLSNWAMVFSGPLHTKRLQPDYLSRMNTLRNLFTYLPTERICIGADLIVEEDGQGRTFLDTGIAFFSCLFFLRAGLCLGSINGIMPLPDLIFQDEAILRFNCSSFSFLAFKLIHNKN